MHWHQNVVGASRSSSDEQLAHPRRLCCARRYHAKASEISVHAHSYVIIDNVRIFVRINHKMHHFTLARHFACLQTSRVSLMCLMRSAVCDRNCADDLVFVTEFFPRGWVKLRARVETRTILYNVRLVSVGAVSV